MIPLFIKCAEDIYWFSFNSIHSMWKCCCCIFSRMPEILSIYFNKGQNIEGLLRLNIPGTTESWSTRRPQLQRGPQASMGPWSSRQSSDWSRSGMTQAERVMQSKSKIDLKYIPWNYNLNFKRNWNYFNGSCEWNKVLKSSGKFYSQWNFNLTN